MNKNYKISLEYSSMGTTYRDSGYARDVNSLAVHRQVIMGLPKDAHLKKIIIKEVKS